MKRSLKNTWLIKKPNKSRRRSLRNFKRKILRDTFEVLHLQAKEIKLLHQRNAVPENMRLNL
jgi:hypothetical protein